jgi:hypothetical protein
MLWVERLKGEENWSCKYVSNDAETTRIVETNLLDNHRNPRLSSRNSRNHRKLSTVISPQWHLVHHVRLPDEKFTATANCIRRRTCEIGVFNDES